MEIDEARKILGKSVEGLTDDQVRDIITDTDFLVSSWLDDYEKTIFGGKTMKEKFNIVDKSDFEEPLQPKSKRKNV